MTVWNCLPGWIFKAAIQNLNSFPQRKLDMTRTYQLNQHVVCLHDSKIQNQKTSHPKTLLNDVSNWKVSSFNFFCMIHNNFILRQPHSIPFKELVAFLKPFPFCLGKFPRSKFWGGDSTLPVPLATQSRWRNDACTGSWDLKVIPSDKLTWE